MTETRTAHDVITDVVATWRGTEAAMAWHAVLEDIAGEH